MDEPNIKNMDEANIKKIGELPGEWYAIRVTSGREQTVANEIKLNAPTVEYLIPTEVIVKIRSGKPTTLKRKTYPGYVMLYFMCDANTVKAIEAVPSVHGFVGSKNDMGFPLAIPREQAAAMIKINKEHSDEFALRTNFAAGDRVKIITGPFVNFDATVEEVNNNKIKVLISVFGQNTSLFLNHLEIEKK